ncbi:MAG TPA: hypothetical protein VFV74_10460 [Burkholderiales bacterium]|nr:hypothetical protein [Burkholderiales bacterium]
MSAAATAAGYLYASGRLRGRAAREQQEHAAEQAKPKPEGSPKERTPLKKPLRVAVVPERPPLAEPRPKRAPRVEYRVRRWRPEREHDE